MSEDKLNGTRLWLATYHVKGDGDFDGARAQRLCVAPLSWDKAQVEDSVTQFLEDVYHHRGKLEWVKDVVDLYDLTKNLLALDMRLQTQLEGVKDHHLPTRLIIEVGYDDYGSSQETPSRAESVLFPCRSLAEAGQLLVDEVIDKQPGSVSWLVNHYQDGPVYTRRSDNPQAAADVLGGMLRDMYPSEEDGESDHEDE